MADFGSLAPELPAQGQQPDPGTAALWLARLLAPNAVSLARGDAAPPIANFPATPGKVPSTSDPRLTSAIGEAANIGVNLVGPPMKGAIAAGAPLVAGIARRIAIPAAEEATRSFGSLAPRTMERLERAAISVDGKIYAGRNHALAIGTAERSTGKSFDEILDAHHVSDGFLTSAGRYVSRDEASQIAKQAQQMRRPTEVNSNLISEDVRRGALWSVLGGGALLGLQNESDRP